MDPLHLQTEELDYELNLRGVFNLSTVRQKSQCLREFLKRETAGENTISRSCAQQLNPTIELTFCANTVSDVCRVLDMSGLGDAVLPQCRSRLIHAIDRVKRAKPEVPEEQIIAYDLISAAESRLAELGQVARSPPRTLGSGLPGEGSSPLADAIEQIRLSQVFAGKLSLQRSSDGGKLGRESALNPGVAAFKPRTDSEAERLESAAERNARRTNELRKEVEAGKDVSFPRPFGNVEVVDITSPREGGAFGGFPRHERQLSPTSNRSTVEATTGNVGVLKPQVVDAYAEPSGWYQRYGSGEPHASSGRPAHEVRGTLAGHGERVERDNRSEHAMRENRFDDRGERFEREYPVERNARAVRNDRGAYNERPFGHAHRKTVPVHQWKVSYSGDGHGLHLYDFLAELHMLQRSEGVTSDELFASVVHLLSGRARLWYRSWYDTFAEWDDFVAAFKHEFLPPKYDYRLLTSISNRRQKQSETFAEYLNVMQSQFNHLSIRIDDQHKLGIIEDNMLAKYAVAASTVNIVSLEQLSNICRRVDFAYSKRDVGPFGEEKTPAARPYSQPRSRELNEFEANTADHFAGLSLNDCQVTGESQDAEVCEVRRGDKPAGNNGANRGKCFNCLREGHNFADCQQPRTGQFCYRCGSRNFTSFSCKDCPKNGEVGSMPGTASNQQRK